MISEREKPFWPAKKWWFALLLVVVLAGILRFTGYDFGLPYIDHVDEPIYNIAAQLIIDDGSPRSIGMHGYPPGIIGLNLALLRLFRDRVTWRIGHPVGPICIGDRWGGNSGGCGVAGIPDSHTLCWLTGSDHLGCCATGSLL